MHLTVAPEGEGVVPLPGLPSASAGVVELVSTAETTALLAGGGETTSLAVLVDGLDDPVDARVAADGLVLGVDADDLVVLVGGVLVDPVGVEDAEVGAAAADTLLSGGLEGALVLELVDTLIVKHLLGSLPLTTSTADADAVDNVTLLGLVSETAGLVGARGAACAVDDLKLAKLSMHSQQSSTSTSIETESQDVHTSQHCRNVSRVLCPSTIVVEYVRERASRSASCPTASSSEVLRHT
ncbi:60S ribosomal protein L15 [Alternaria alternata]|nr:60S ribosomal protein L15 [Alternaria alternata]